MSATDKSTLQKAIEALDKVKAEYEDDNGRLAIITPDLYAESNAIIENHFLPDDPLCTAFGAKWHDDFEKSVHKDLVQNVSICMISKHNDEIMGVQLIGSMNRSDSPSDFSSMKYEPLRSIYEFLNHKENEINVFDKYDVEEAMLLSMLCVHKRYRRKGLGGRLVGAAIAMNRELGFKAFKCEGTSNFSQRIFERQGFETLVKLPYDSYCYNGHYLIDATGEHTQTIIYGLML